MVTGSVHDAPDAGQSTGVISQTIAIVLVLPLRSAPSFSRGSGEPQASRYVTTPNLQSDHRARGRVKLANTNSATDWPTC